ncbi:Uncharacterised protein [uncultured archaeon]|nr:Uncharacterised protein [uncultured archaeon]
MDFKSTLFKKGFSSANVMKNKKNLTSLSLVLLFSLFIISFASASSLCDPSISLVSQDPNPAVPGEYVKVVFEISGLGNCNGYAVKLAPDYPFSLDSNDSLIQTISSSPYVPDTKDVWMVSYKLRVDPAAINGDYNVTLEYNEGNYMTPFYSAKAFNLSVQDSRTSFDAVIQAINGNEVSIAIANTGKYAANSVVVRIPSNQSYYQASGIDGQMVGNLASGDYTIVGFSITPKISRQNQTTGTNPNSGINYMPQQDKNLQCDIYYTDNIGQRRIASLELPLKLTTNTTASGAYGNFPGSRRSTTTSINLLSSINFWIIIALIAIVAFFLYRKYSEQIKEFFSKKKQNSSSEEAPSWVKNHRNKLKS